MNKKIGVRELKSQTSQIVRQVREEAAEYVITHHGRPVAILKPIDEEESKRLEKAASKAVLADLLEIGAQLSENHPDAPSATQLLTEMRDKENA